MNDTEMSSPDVPTPGPDAEFARRLASLQRTLTQTLVAADPLTTLLGRLKATCNANVAIIDRYGEATNVTGTMPLAGLYQAIAGTTNETQEIEFEGWRAVVDRLHDGDDIRSHAGWLVMISRQPNFPDPYQSAAIQLGAALVETCQRIGTVARGQELAIRSATLGEMLAFRPMRDDSTLIGKVTSLGLNLDDEVRIAVVRPARRTPGDRGTEATTSFRDGVRNALEGHPIRHLLSSRDGNLVVAFQATTATFKRVVTTSGRLPGCSIGVGRAVRQIADFSQSLNDAELALQTMRFNRRGVHLLAYEDFDLAMRLFADVGLDEIGRWARSFLAPVLDRPPLIQGLHAYFRNGQNINATAEELHIHHNSLRYRLAKVEQVLSVALHDPAAISSLFLALRALELERFDFSRGVHPRRGDISDIAAPDRVGNTETLPTADGLGVARSPRSRRPIDNVTH